MAEQGSYEAGIAQTRYLQNATYARLKNLSVGYTLPQKWTDKVNIDRLRIFFSGDNLCEITGLYKHYKIDQSVWEDKCIHYNVLIHLV